jgi:hypothetical protein
LFKRSHRIEFRITAFAVLAFFVAQMGAIAHAYTHRPATQTSTTQQSHELCGECLNFAPLLSAAGTPASLAYSLQHNRSATPAVARSSLVDHHTHLVFRSRAPPVT